MVSVCHPESEHNKSKQTVVGSRGPCIQAVSLYQISVKGHNPGLTANFL